MQIWFLSSILFNFWILSILLPNPRATIWFSKKKREKIFNWDDRWLAITPIISVDVSTALITLWVFFKTYLGIREKNLTLAQYRDFPLIFHTHEISDKTLIFLNQWCCSFSSKLVQLGCIHIIWSHILMLLLQEIVK